MRFIFNPTPQKIFVRFILLFSTMFLVSQQKEDSYTECLKLSSTYKELNIKCDKFLNAKIQNNTNIPLNKNNTNESVQNELERKGNRLLLQSYNMYKKNFLELYDIYNNNEDYKGFITAMDKTLREKYKSKNDKEPKLRFTQSKSQIDNVNYDSFFNSEKRKEISEKFINGISSDKLRNEIKSQYKHFKESDMKQVYLKEQDFFKNEGKIAKSDSKAVELSTKLYGSINAMADKYKDQKPTGILTVDGKIATDPGSYIRQEEARLKKSYTEGSSYNYKDIKKLMKLEDLGNEITIMAK